LAIGSKIIDRGCGAEFLGLLEFGILLPSSSVRVKPPIISNLERGESLKSA
jgi:hypothetical protein